ncbi:hypothetical protein B0A50_03187 [Salinomyces thailandicus]|uniref:Uncharacterized protein n=1 Tax=Salinomyces thailandicus TaxID=706561 RepID=A0A4U0U418_9PEZI|nr:hypothetical protein B0A50_03187 [Salinomyces thailandica]
MATLVAYSDSETSDTDTAPKPPAAATTSKPTPTSTKAGKPTTRKIQVSLPALQPEPRQQAGADEPPAKRARTSGASGFNALLPAPKRAAPPPSGLKKGVSLKTSSEAGFNRAARAEPEEGGTSTGAGLYGAGTGEGDYDEFGNRRAGGGIGGGGEEGKKEGEEVKLVGKATRFRPLSVANNKNKKKKTTTTKNVTQKPGEPADAVTGGSEVDSALSKQAEAVAPPMPPKAKQSLFSVAVADEPDEVDPDDTAISPHHPAQKAPPPQPPQPPQPKDEQPLNSQPRNTLETLATDLSLTPSERRQLFGRHHNKNNNNTPQLTHFNLSAEYAANEDLRQSSSGDAAPQQAIKAVAPGKHSLQQLVGNARRNAEGIEEVWAEGRRKQGGGRYGWGGG